MCLRCSERTTLNAVLPRLQQIHGQELWSTHTAEILYYTTETWPDLQLGNEDFSTQIEVGMRMSVSICVNLFEYIPIHHVRFQDADIKIFLQMQFNT
jgi:hypothetical protein